MNFNWKKRIFFIASSLAIGCCALAPLLHADNKQQKSAKTPSYKLPSKKDTSSLPDWKTKVIPPVFKTKSSSTPKPKQVKTKTSSKSDKKVSALTKRLQNQPPVLRKPQTATPTPPRETAGTLPRFGNNKVVPSQRIQSAQQFPNAPVPTGPQISQPIPLRSRTSQFTPSFRSLPATSIRNVSALQTDPGKTGSSDLLEVPVPSNNEAVIPPVPRDSIKSSPNQFLAPLNNPSKPDSDNYHSKNGRIWLMVRDAPITSVLGLIAQDNGLNIVASSEVTGQVTVTLADVRLEDALSSILVVNGYTWSRENNILLISQLNSESQSSAMAQGKQVQVFPLNYVSATDVDVVIKGLLSPVGNSFISQTDKQDKLKTREEIVVEDLPEYLERIQQYITQIDHPPQQVYIEAHVLQVTLSDDDRHGVNFNQFFQLASTEIQLKTTGFANALASPSFSLGLDTPDLNMLIEWLQTTTDSKTLASPKVSVVNGQEAKIQVGEKLGYLVTTTTQTSTLQEVNFLDLGVVLKVTPQITNNNQVLMTVKPEVSSGRINPDTGLPEEDTTEVETSILLSNGQGMVIGGLIKEIDLDSQSKVPFLGDIWVVGKLFQKHTLTRERNEIIIALIPKIMPYDQDCYCDNNSTKLQQATTPLFEGPLHRVNRPWEPRLPSPIDNPRYYRSCCCKLPYYTKLTSEYPKRPEHYFPTVYETKMEQSGGYSQGYSVSPPPSSNYYRIQPGMPSSLSIPPAPASPEAKSTPLKLIKPKL